MQILLETRSLSWAESVRLALLGEGIDAVIVDQASAAALGLAGSMRVAILDDADITRANEIVVAMQPPKTPPLASWWFHKRALVAFVAGFVLVNFAMDAANASSRRVIAGVLTVSAIICLASAIVLVVLGYRADGTSEPSAEGVLGE